MTKEWSKEEYRRQGVPVGVGAPENPDPETLQRPLEENEIRILQARAQQQEAEGMQAMQMAAMEAGQYRGKTPAGDKAKILDYINTISPYQFEIIKNPQTGRDELNIISGDIEFELYRKFNGYLAHNSSMGHFNDQELKVEEVNLDICEIEVRMSMGRSEYTPEFNAQVRNAKHLAKIKLYQNKDGMERYLAAAEIQDDLKAYKMMQAQRPSRLAQTANAIRGRE
jgi:hypothetical protein